MNKLAGWLLEELRGRAELRSTGRELSEPELDALAAQYGYELPVELRGLLRLDAAYVLPPLGGLTLRLRPPASLLGDAPAPMSCTGWLPLVARFGGLYPLATGPAGELYAVALQGGVVYRYRDLDAVARVAGSLRDFFSLLLRGGALPALEGAGEEGVLGRLLWAEAFASERYPEAAEWLRLRPSPAVFEAEASRLAEDPTLALYWLLDAHFLGEVPLGEVLAAAALNRAPLVRRLARYVTSEPRLAERAEGRAQLFYERARYHEGEDRQSLLRASLTASAPTERVVGALALSSPETAAEFVAQLNQLAGEAAPARRDDLRALATLALAYAGQAEAALAQADVLAWEWRQDPWYGTRHGEAERLAHLVSTYAVAGQEERASHLLDFVLEKAPAAGAALAAGVELALSRGDLDGAARELSRALSLAPGSPELHAVRAKLAGRGHAISWVEEGWPPFLQDLVEEAMTGDTAARLAALERLRRTLELRAEEVSLPLPFLLAIVERDPPGRPPALRVLALCRFREAVPVLEAWAGRRDTLEEAGLAARALSAYPLEEADAALARLLEADVFSWNGELLPGLARGPRRGELVRRALGAALARRSEAAPALLRAYVCCPDASLYEPLARWVRPECGREAAEAALSVLGLTEDPRALPLLQQLAASLDPRVAHAAREALAVLGAGASPVKARSPLAGAPPEELALRLRDADRETATQIAQLATGRAAWELDTSLRDELQSIRALALAKSGMLRDAVELADVLAWGWRQDPLCGERPGEPERLTRLVDAYRVAGRMDRARPLLEFIRTKSQADAPLALEIDIALDAGNDEQAEALLRDALHHYPGSRWLYPCRTRLLARGRHLSFSEPAWPSAVREALERAATPDPAQRARALETLAGVLRLRRLEAPSPVPLSIPFLVSVALYDEPLVARAALQALAVHPPESAAWALRIRAEGDDLDLAALAVGALAQLPSAEPELAALVHAGRYHKLPSLLTALAEHHCRGGQLREALRAAISREELASWCGPWLLRALAPCAEAEDVELCLPLLQTDTPRELRGAALAVLRASDSASLPALAAQLEGDQDYEIAEVARVLARA